MQIPAATLDAIAREEHFYSNPIARVRMGCWRGGKHHAQAHRFPRPERLGEGLAAERVVDEAAPIVGEDADTRSIPAGRAPGRIRLGHESDGQAAHIFISLLLLLLLEPQDLHLVVHRPCPLGDGRRVAQRIVQRQGRDKRAVAAVPVALDLPAAGARRGDAAAEFDGLAGAEVA